MNVGCWSSPQFPTWRVWSGPEDWPLYKPRSRDPVPGSTRPCPRECAGRCCTSPLSPRSLCSSVVAVPVVIITAVAVFFFLLWCMCVLRGERGRSLPREMAIPQPFLHSPLWIVSTDTHAPQSWPRGIQSLSDHATGWPIPGIAFCGGNYVKEAAVTLPFSPSRL